MPEISSPTHFRTARNEEIRLPLGGALIVTDHSGRQLFRVEEDGDIFRAGDVPIGLGLKITTVHLTSAAILALNSSPTLLLAAAPGVFKWPIAAFLSYTAGGTPYSYDGLNIYIGPGVPAISPYLLTGALLITKAVSDVAPLAGNPSAVNLPDPDTFIGSDISIGGETADPTDGDGTIDVTVLYYEVTL